MKTQTKVCIFIITCGIKIIDVISYSKVKKMPIKLNQATKYDSTKKNIRDSSKFIAKIKN